MRRLIFLLLASCLLIPVPGVQAENSSAEEAWIQAIDSPQYFAVSVEDVDRAIAWYQTTFGLEVLDDTTAENGAWRIANLTRDGLFVEVIFDQRDAPKQRSRGIAKVGFRVPDVRTVADRVEAATGERPRVLDFGRHQVRLLQLRDPEGNVIQLTSPLPTPTDEPQDGSSEGEN